MQTPTKVRYSRDGTEFTPVVSDYPFPAGSKYIECPTCGHRYFYDAKTDIWESDRFLVILNKEKS